MQSVRFFKCDYAEAVGQLLIDDTFVINVTIRKSRNGEFFVSYPSYKDRNGEYKNVAYCTKQKVNDIIISEFKKWKISI